MSKTRVAPLTAGQVIVVSSDNTEFGHIRVTQTRNIFDDRGWLKPTQLSALVPGEVKHLKNLGWKEGQELPGHIVIKESFTPFNKKDPDKDLKIAGDSKVVCTQDGKKIYRKCFYSEVKNAEDQTIEHDNQEEIRQAFLAIEATKTAGATSAIGKM